MPSYVFLPAHATLLRCVRCTHRYFVVPKPEPQAVTCEHCARELSAKYEDARNLAKSYRRDLIIALIVAGIFAAILIGRWI